MFGNLVEACELLFPVHAFPMQLRLLILEFSGGFRIDNSNPHALIGLPKEGYGFSNNAKVNFAPPVFEAAAFNLDVGDKSIRLRVVY